MPKELITETYVVLMKNFFDSVSKSDNMKELNFPVSSLCIGIHSIHRVFEYAIMKTKNIERAIYYAQQTYSYYLEYMNQIHQSNLSQNLNHIDAVLFVYKKTIFHMFDGEQNEDASNTMSNIITLHEQIQTFDEKEYQNLFARISKLSNILFDWQNECIEFSHRLSICNEYLSRFLKQIDFMTSTTEYLEILQTKMSMNYEKYENLLKEILEKKEKVKRPRADSFFSETDRNEYFLMKFYIEEPILIEKFDNGNNMKEFVKWMYQTAV